MTGKGHRPATSKTQAGRPRKDTGEQEHGQATRQGHRGDQKHPSRASHEPATIYQKRCGQVQPARLQAGMDTGRSCYQDCQGYGLTANVEPADWHVAVRYAYAPESRARHAHINEKEAGALVLAIRWAARSRRTRRCRLVVQSDSAAAVCALRKGRSSRPGMRRQCRKIAALTLAHGITAEFRWVPTNRNMADRPSRGSAAPGPCESDPRVERAVRVAPPQSP